MARTFADGKLLEVTSALVTAEPFTICVWVRPSVLSTAMGIGGVATSGSTDHYHSIFLESNNQFVIRSRDAATLAAIGVAGQAAQDVWTHVCGIWASASSRTIIVNGTNSANDTTTVSTTGMNRTWIGKYIDVVGNLEWNGDLAEFAIWNVALTTDEVAALARRVNPRRVQPDALVSYVPIWGLHAPEIDLTGARTWPLTNAPGAAPHVPVGLFSGQFWAIPFFETTTPQFARPSTDTTRDGWETDTGGTTNLYEMLDETTRNDADYIRTGLTPTNDVYVSKLSGLTDPQTSSGHILKVAYGKETPGGDQIDITVELRQGYINESSQGTLIASRSLTNISGVLTLDTYTLSGSEADAITDYNNLYFRVIGNKP